ncbi:efflux RND transporter periplasmic adaptor subunit [Bacillus sp. 03113]|uniref:efflux RND transporter periplasmic adaptor subunit n=1 Tax=Bacillus sp. 03113 TaxID=2578211 RepID=UPI0011447182|nr:efflux RND transporter periplasmic adaptor subunit [Bacillus sp. 03113]
MKKKLWIGIGVVSVIVIMVGVSVYRQAYAKAPSFEVAKPKQEEISSTIMVPGTLKFESEQVVYSSPDKGELKEILVKEGDTVEKGAALAQYENPQLSLELEQNKLSIESGNLKIAQLDRQKKQLDDKKAELSKEMDKKDAEKQLQPDYEQLDMDRKMANIELKQSNLQKDTLEKQIKDLQIKSTLNGTVLTVDSQSAPGTETTGASPIIHIGDLNTLIASGLLSEYDTLKVTPGQKVVLTSDAVPDQKWEGEISRVGTIPQQGSTGAQESQAVQYPVTIKINSQNLGLKPGFQLIMEIETEKKTALVVPVDSVIQEGQNQFVYVYDKHTALKKEVKTGIASGETIEITSGLSEKEQVITNPSDNLKEGMEVTTR